MLQLVDLFGNWGYSPPVKRLKITLPPVCCTGQERQLINQYKILSEQAVIWRRKTNAFNTD